MRTLLLALLAAAILYVAEQRCTTSAGEPTVDSRNAAIVLNGTVEVVNSTSGDDRYYIDFEYHNTTGAYVREDHYRVTLYEYMRYYRGHHELCVNDASRIVECR